MSELYNFEYYHGYCGPIPYENPEHWVEFFGMIADRIVKDLHPATVLDAGCAMGYLVAELRDRGVEAYGIDISEYAISKVREDIKPYCVVGSLTEPLPETLPQRYDLVVTIEVLEHLYAEDGKKAIQNLCTLSDQIIFSSTPDDFTERTHVNVQQREYWARLFATEGFFDDINYRPTYLTAYASYFCRGRDWLRQVEDYERNIRMTETQQRVDTQNWSKAVEDKERHIQNQNAMLEQAEQQRQELDAKYQAELQAAEQREEALRQKNEKALKEAEDQISSLEQARETTEKELAHYQEHYHVAIGQREDLKRQLAEIQSAYHEISTATCWKMTKPIRVVLDAIKRLLKSNRYTHLFCKGLKCLKENGVRYTWHKVQDKLHHRQDFAKALKPLYTEQELQEQKTVRFPQKIKFSILVPLYNTPENFLREMIQSILDQTYADWELCLADGSDEKHCDVEHICRQYARKDHRIRYQKLKENLGISGNTNACIDMATGDYIALFDHDDLLHPAALFEVMKAICEQNADFIYTDEAAFESPNINDIKATHFKPDFSPDTLRSHNYICHFTVFSRTLLKEAGGGFRSKFDGSQDYDIILRLTEKAEHITHIQKILYYWRSHSASVASDISAKPYTIPAAKGALAEHLERIGLKGEVLDSMIPSTYHIQYEIQGNPQVSILIPNKDHIKDLDKCIHSILEKTTYPNWEIIIVENNSEDADTFAYYERIQREDCRVRVVQWNGEFNFSAINNFGAGFANGEHLLLLNNDIEVITPDWLEQMLMFSQRSDVGAVGAMLYYPDDTVQHAGVILGIGGYAGHAHKHFTRGSYGYISRMTIAQNLTAVTGACMMVRRDVWDKVNGLDETFVVACNDVDLCMRIRQAGYLIVWTPYAELYHYESKSRGYEDTPEKKKRFEGEVRRFQQRWAKELAAGDPYYNPNFTLDRENFSIK